MSLTSLTLVAMLAPALLLGGLMLRRSLATERASNAALERARAEGLYEPPSLHPVIDEAACIGCGGCVEACPEGSVLGLVEGKAELTSPAECIGHGACRAACPTTAIDLVFGTERRGIDIPHVTEEFETNVPGIFIAGELGGMGLIRNAIEQGRQAIDAIAARERPGDDDRLDVLIVGAGPAGFSATLAAKQHKLRSVTVEQDTLGGTVAHYPRGKIVMTAPAQLPLVGKMRFRETTKERLLEFWQDVERKTGAQIRYQERVEQIVATDNRFLVTTTQGRYETRTILLAIGRRGTPRRLGVPGEDQSKVVYRLLDPEQYAGRRILVIGGGDSALEAAIALGTQAGTRVTLSYRGEGFSRAKAKNRERLSALEGSGKMHVKLQSTVRQIEENEVWFEGETTHLPNDDVIVCAGGILPTGFLRGIGVAVETKHGTS